MKSKTVQQVVPVPSLCWISGKSSPAGLPAAESLSMSTASAALAPASQGNNLFFCPYPACLGSAAVLGAARKEGEVVANARCPPPSSPSSYPLRLGRESVRGGGVSRRRSTGTMCQSHLSLPSLPPAPHKPRSTMGLGNTACV